MKNTSKPAPSRWTTLNANAARRGWPVSMPTNVPVNPSPKGGQR